MARPKTVGEAIQIRLPLELHERVIRAAATRGISPGLYLRGMVTDVLTQGEPVNGTARVRGIGETVVSTCTHPKAKVTVVGAMARCECGAIRGVDGTWR